MPPLSTPSDGLGQFPPKQILYGASPSQIPVKEGYKLYDWYLDSEFNNFFDSQSGVTEDITLYAFWIDESVTYRFHKYIERLPAGTDGTFGTEGIYYLFGDYPQSLIAENVVIDENKRVDFEGLENYLNENFNEE